MNRAGEEEGSSIWLKFVISAVLLLLAVIVLFTTLLQSRTLAPAYTRVAGTTRAETAVEVSRFWLAPKHVVLVAEVDDPTVISAAAACAVALDAPLLYLSVGRQTAMVEHRLRQLHGENEALTEVTFDSPEDKCPETSAAPAIATWSPSASASAGDDVGAAVLQAADDLMPTTSELAPTIVLAAPQTTEDEPDVAVAAPLAARMSRSRGSTGEEGVPLVTLVLLGKYSEPAHKMFESLREQDTRLESVVVVGGERAIAKETQEHVTRVLNPEDRLPFLRELSNTLTALEACLLALFAFTAVGPLAVQSGGAVLERVGRWSRSRTSDHRLAAWFAARSALSVKSEGTNVITMGASVRVHLTDGAVLAGRWQGTATLMERRFVKVELQPPDAETKETRFLAEGDIREIILTHRSDQDATPPGRGS